MKKILSFLTTITIGVLCLTGCSFGKDDSSKYNINIESNDNVKVNAYVSFDKSEIILYLTNNNDYNIGNLEVESKYTNNNGNSIGDDGTSLLDFKKGTDYVTTIDLPYDDNYENYVPDKIDIKIYIDQEYQEIVDDIDMYDDKISSSYQVENGNVKVTLTNNSKVTLAEIEAAVLFMKDGKPIAVDIIRGFDVSKTYSESIEIPTDWEKSDDEDVPIKYDSIKVVINRAIKDY